MASPAHFKDFKRWFTRQGVAIAQCASASHHKMTKVIDGKMVIYIIAVHSNTVDPVYTRKARRRFRLLREDGVSDKDFFA